MGGVGKLRRWKRLGDWRWKRLGDWRWEGGGKGAKQM